jgi:hypothetical protein
MEPAESTRALNAWTDFEVPSPRGGKVHHCRFHTLATGISPRHSDTVDVKFLVNGSPVVLALPHAAFAEHLGRTGTPLTDQDAVRIAGIWLKRMLERGERVDTPLHTLTTQQTLELAETPGDYF